MPLSLPLCLSSSLSLTHTYAHTHTRSLSLSRTYTHTISLSHTHTLEGDWCTQIQWGLSVWSDLQNHLRGSATRSPLYKGSEGWHRQSGNIIQVRHYIRCVRHLNLDMSIISNLFFCLGSVSNSMLRDYSKFYNVCDFYFWDDTLYFVVFYFHYSFYFVYFLHFDDLFSLFFPIIILSVWCCCLTWILQQQYLT